MPFPSATPRELIHTRQIQCRGYLRKDGMWDIEGHLVDTKTYTFKNDHRGEVKAGDPVHEMWLRLTVDNEMTIREVEATTDHSPFAVCPAVIPNFRRLQGLRIGKGFINKVRELLGGVEGCTHLVEMIGPLATTAFQTIFPYRSRIAGTSGRNTDSNRKPQLLNTCHAFAESGEVAQRLWPELRTQNKV